MTHDVDAVRPSVLEYHEISEVDRRVQNPFSESNIALVGEICRLEPDHRLLDLCCGKGELLCTWSRDHGVSGVGVDISDVFLAAARTRASELGVESRVTFASGDAAAFARDCVDRFDIVSCIGASWIGGGLMGTLELMRGCCTAAPLVLVGEPYWRTQPTMQALDRIGEDFTDLAGTVRRCQAAGLDVVEMVLASQDDWDRYEASQWWAMDRWLHEHPDDPKHEHLHQALTQSRDDYVAWQRDQLGWGIFVLRPAEGLRQRPERCT